MSFENLNDAHRPSRPDVFLDTSIFCSMHKGPLFRPRIQRVLRLFRWKATSSYVNVEYGNVVLAQAEYYLRKLDQFQSLAAVKDFIGNVLPHQLHAGKVTWSFSLLENHYGANDAECTERARLSLRRMMKLGVGFVERQCDKPIEDGTACHWARLGVKRRTDGRLVWQSPKCERQNKRCRLDEFFTTNQETFQKIKHAIDVLPDTEKSPQLRDFSEVIGLASGDPGVLLDYAICRRLADAIIAVDSRSYRNMFSQNVRESELLTDVLGQVFYYLPANPQGGVQVRIPGKSE
jgi:hypothetical protein